MCVSTISRAWSWQSVLPSPGRLVVPAVTNVGDLPGHGDGEPADGDGGGDVGGDERVWRTAATV